MAKETSVERAISAIAAGEPVDPAVWSSDEPLLAELRALYDIGRVYREALAPIDSLHETVGAPPPASLGRPAGRWAHFYLLEQIGQGASSIVYRAWDSRLAREVALKLIPTAAASGASTLSEARRLARIRHPHVVSVFGAEQTEDHVGIWMDLLKGRTLVEIVATQGVFNAREACLIGGDLCSALAAVHQAGLLHRDVKAANVVREQGGRIVLMDLGAGREIASDAPIDLAGTPLYMAPELFTGTAASVESDLYSVGVLLCFLTTGATPISATTMAELRQVHTARTSRTLTDLRPDLPRPFVNVVERALAPDPAARFHGAGEMQRALTGALVSPSGEETGGKQLRRWGFLTRRIPAWAAGLAGVTAVAIALLIGSFVSKQAPGEAPAIDAAQLKVARGFEELAASLANQGRWPDAIRQFQEAARITRLAADLNSPLVAIAISHVAWAQQQGGAIDEAQANYELAIAKFRRFGLDPLVSAAYRGLARVHQAAGRFDAAAGALDSALETWAHAMGGEATQGERGGLARLGLSAAAIIDRLKQIDLDRDDDGDWLPDALEAAIGLNPASPDSDSDAILDGDEDSDADGLSNAQELALPVDSFHLIAQYGAVDPLSLGFRQPDDERFEGKRGTRASWRIARPGTSIYWHPLTAEQREAALRRGWRIVTRGEVRDGGGFANLDLIPSGSRFDLNFYLEPGGGSFVQLNSTVVPREGATASVSRTGRWPLTELMYDPAMKAARLLVDGKQRDTPPYVGHHNFQEGLGLFFGSHNEVGLAKAGDAEFDLVLLILR
jgi:serine/threonine-protein kinase